MASTYSLTLTFDVNDNTVTRTFTLVPFTRTGDTYTAGVVTVPVSAGAVPTNGDGIVLADTGSPPTNPTKIMVRNFSATDAVWLYDGDLSTIGNHIGTVPPGEVELRSMPTTAEIVAVVPNLPATATADIEYVVIGE